MKNAKKVLAMVIVLALAISMAIPVSAEETTGSITVNNVLTDGTVYTAWQLATLTYDAAKDAYTYTVNPAWKDFFSSNSAAAAVFELDGDYLKEKDGLSAEERTNNMKTFAEAVKAQTKVEGFDETTGIVKIASAPSSAGAATIANVPLGYYFVDSTLGTICAVNTFDNDGNVTVEEKNSLATLDKNIVEEGNKVKVNDAAIGDTVNYEISITVGKGAEGYVVTDTLATGLAYQDDADFEVYRKNGEGTSEVVTTTVTMSDGAAAKDSNGVITFTFENEETLQEGDVIVITYSAVVEQDAVIEDTGNTNSAYLTFGEQQARTEEATVTTYVWSFDIFKYYGQETPLSGAGFTIKEGSTVLKFTKVGNVYKLDMNNPNAISELVTGADGILKIEGLDSSTYTVEETTVPDGFNKATDTTVVIGTENGGTTQTVSGTTDNQTVKILNQSGALLPSTGGTGTVIFIAVGSFLVLAMGVLLVVRKRMSKVVYTR